MDALDIDDTGEVSVTDPIVALTHLFLAGPRPSSPFPACGPDPTGDGLGCDAFDGCP
jgi:hypothetical protein